MQRQIHRPNTNPGQSSASGGDSGGSPAFRRAATPADERAIHPLLDLALILGGAVWGGIATAVAPKTDVELATERADAPPRPPVVVVQDLPQLAARLEEARSLLFSEQA